jgi:ribose/xylose/arabinose/galactoside ABC-type transport system permease subunit
MNADVSYPTEPVSSGNGGGWALLGLLRRAASAVRIGLVVLVLLVLGTLLSSDFLTVTNLRNLLNQTSILGVLALAQFFVVLIGGFDLSVAAVLALSSVIVATLAPRYGLPVSGRWRRSPLAPGSAA